MTDTSPALEFKSIHKSFGENRALADAFLPPSGVRLASGKLSSLVVRFVLAAVLCAGTAAFAFDKIDLMKLEVKNSCPNCDLSGANLSGAILSRVNFRGANLFGANLSKTNLRSADLRGSNLQGANLFEADLWDANLYKIDLRKANLRNADLRKANLWGADFTGANIEGAEMKGATFCNTKMPWGIDNDDCPKN